MREGEGAQFFCMRSLSSKENGEAFPASCAFLRLQGGVFKKFSTHHVIHCKKNVWFSRPQSGCQALPDLLNYFWIRECLTSQLRDGKTAHFFLQCMTNISLLRVLLFGSVVVKFEQSIVVILCTTILKSVFKLHYYRVCIKSKNNLKMHSGSGTPPLQSREKKQGYFFPAPIL